MIGLLGGLRKMVSLFLASFLSVFLKGFQHQNVIGGKYKSAFVISYFMAVMEVVVIALIVKEGWSSVVPVGTGSALGITSSMYLYRATEKEGIASYIRSIFWRNML